MSWNGQVKEYFLDAAGYAERGFAEISANWDDWPETFDQGSQTAASFNDALRIGLNALGYGSELGDFDEIQQDFNFLSSNFGATHPSLNRMLRLWADDQVSGALREQFQDLAEDFDSIVLVFGSPPRISINTALRRAITSTISPTKAFGELNTLFDTETGNFDGIDVGFGINSAANMLFGTYAFGDATRAAFEIIGAKFDMIEMSFGGGGRTGNITTFDREDRRFEMIN